MANTSKSPWRRKLSCKCVKAELLRSGPVVIRCVTHRGKPAKGRLVCFLDDDGIVRRGG